VARSLAQAGVERRPEDVLPVFLNEYGKVLLETTRLYPGVAGALDALRDRTLAVLTNKPGDMSRAILEGLGVATRFARVMGGGDLGPKKPDPEGLRRLMDEAAARPEATVMVGDSAVDVRTGRAAGALTVGVTYGFDRPGLDREPPDVLLDSLAELRPRLDERESVG
jgi:phosphoglycolate phosphatase